MRFPSQSSIFAFGLATAVTAQGQFLVSELSFGYTGRINDRGQATVPGFSIQGTPSDPEILSNKVILTPPHPGNARGAAWAEQPNQYREWAADVDFRVNGGERGSGNLNIWLARGGGQDIGSASIYTVGKFDGLALVVDQHGGSAGMIRGFLNDGSTDFKSHHSLDSLAFGHCYHSYRNLGRPSQIKLRQTATKFQVEIDNRLCFESDQITIPPGYHFGITAASADNPDSFEIFKLVVMTGDLAAKVSAGGSSSQQQQQQQQNDGGNQARAQTSYGRQNQNQNQNSGGQNVDGSFDDSDLPDTSADSITSSKAQFADLHNRLQSINHHLSTIFRQGAGMNNMAEKRHEETSKMISDLKQSLSKLDKLDRLEQMASEVTKLQREIQNIKTDLNNRVSQSENNLKRAISSNHGTMLEHVAVQTTPAHGKLIFVIIGSQIVLVVGYILYERKKTMPKKYL
ncbi:legume-like lectin family protein [Astrocystis sublimbata]|nr:legume-like lectin family protein [Astrocystis sublimbata]